MTCWLAQFSDKSCDGPLVRAHLVPRQLLKRELGRRHAEAAVEDPRSWVPACGGPTGCGGHHGMLDQSRSLRIPRAALPPELEEFAASYALDWWLDREYGPRELAA